MKALYHVHKSLWVYLSWTRWIQLVILFIYILILSTQMRPGFTSGVLRLFDYAFIVSPMWSACFWRCRSTWCYNHTVGQNRVKMALGLIFSVVTKIDIANINLHLSLLVQAIFIARSVLISSWFSVLHMLNLHLLHFEISAPVLLHSRWKLYVCCVISLDLK